MRKLICLSLFVVGTFSLATAQTIIPRVGLTVTSTTTDEVATTEQVSNISSQSGYTFGVGYNVPVTILGKGLLSLQPELTYVQKGYKGTTSGEFNIGEAYYQFTGTSEISVNYFEIPILAKYELGSNKIKAAVFAGPSIGFGLGGKFKSTSNVDTGEEVQVYHSEGNIVFYRPDNNAGDLEFDHNIDIGIQGGASITLLNRVTVDARYGMGLTDVKHGNESKNRVFQVGIAVPIKLK